MNTESQRGILKLTSIQFSLNVHEMGDVTNNR